MAIVIIIKKFFLQPSVRTDVQSVKYSQRTCGYEMEIVLGNSAFNVALLYQIELRFSKSYAWMQFC